MNLRICATCDWPIRPDNSVYFWLDRQTMEHLRCHVPWFDTYTEVEASPADPAYGPMS